MITWNKPVVHDASMDRKLSLFVVAFFIVQLLNTSIKTLIPLDSSRDALLSNALLAFLALLMLRTLPYVIREKGGTLAILELVLLVVYLGSYCYGYANSDILVNYAFWSMGVCVPMACHVLCIVDFRILYDAVLKASYLVFALMVPCGIASASGNGYSMTFAMASLPFCFIWIAETERTRKPVHIVLAVYAILFLVVFGNRGALLCLVYYLLCRLLLVGQLTARKASVGIFVGVVCAAIVVNYESAILFIQSMLDLSGIHSYSLNRFLTGTWLQSSGRDALTNYYVEKIASGGFLGYGVCGAWPDVGAYPHNGLLWLLVAFGPVIGGVLCIAFILSFVISARAYRGKKSKQTELLLSFSAACFSQLLTSALAVTSPALYLYIALLCRTALTREAMGD